MKIVHGAALALAVLLSACGGGGGADSSSPTPSTPTFPAPQAQISSINPAQPELGKDISFSAGPANVSLTYRWNFGDGQTADGAAVTHRYAATGSFTVTLTVTDAHSQSASATSSVQVLPTPLTAQIAKVSNAAPELDETVSFESVGTGMGELKFDWLVDGVLVRTDGSAGSFAHTFQKSGAHTVTLRVTEKSGQTVSASTTINVAAPALPIAHIESADNQVSIDELANFKASAAAVNKTYSWDFGDGSPAQVSTADMPNQSSHRYARAGTFSVTLSVFNKQGDKAMASLPIKVIEAPPSGLSITAGVASAGAQFKGIPIEYTATVAGAGPFNFKWRFGDGGTATGAKVTHAFSSGGNFAVEVEASDRYGRAANASLNQAINSIGLSWLTGADTVPKLTRGSGRLANTDGVVSQLACDPRGQPVWVRGSSMLVTLDAQGKVSQFLTTEQRASYDHAFQYLRLDAMRYDGAGQLYLRASNGALMRIKKDGALDTLGKLGYQPSSPSVIAPAPGGAVYFVEGINGYGQRINRFDPSTQTITTVAGTLNYSAQVDGKGESAGLKSIKDLVVLPDGDVLLAEVASTYPFVDIRRVAKDGTVTTVDYVTPLRSYSYNIRLDAAADGRVFVMLDRDLIEINPGGEKFQWGEYAAGSAGLYSVAVCPAIGAQPAQLIYGQGGEIKAKNADRVEQVLLGGFSAWRHPMGEVNVIGADPRGFSFVRVGSAIGKMDAQGKVTVFAGDPALAGSADGPGRDARFGASFEAAVASDGSLWVADKTKFTVRRVTPDGQVSTVAGIAGSKGPALGNGIYARFGDLTRIVAADSNSAFVIDGRFLRRVGVDGAVTHVLDLEPADGTPPGSITQMSVDSQGVLFLSRSCGIQKLVAGNQLVVISGDIGPQFRYSCGSARMDSEAATAKFSGIASMSFDAQGNLLILDASSVRQLTKAGRVVTLMDFTELRLSNDQGELEVSVLPSASRIAVTPSGELLMSDPYHALVFTTQGLPGMTKAAAVLRKRMR